MSSALPFRTLAPWLKQSFGMPVYRVALDAGSTCPNRDGTKGLGGCTYCDVEGSGTGALRGGDELEEQLRTGLKRIERRKKTPDEAIGAIAYLQSYTNTYVDATRLDEVLGVIESYLDNRVVCLSVSTRPDCLSDETLQSLTRVAQRVPVWVELGLECANDDVLQAINRLHTVAEFEDAVERVHAAGLAAVGHAILGLPGDGREGARRTAQVLAQSGVAGVKAHHLMVLKRTQMAKTWQTGHLPVLTLEEYVEWLADFVERLRPDQVLHRLTGDSPRENLLAPHWGVNKNQVRESLADCLRHRGTEQGTLCSASWSSPPERA